MGRTHHLRHAHPREYNVTLPKAGKVGYSQEEMCIVAKAEVELMVTGAKLGPLAIMDHLSGRIKDGNSSGDYMQRLTNLRKTSKYRSLVVSLFEEYLARVDRPLSQASGGVPLAEGEGAGYD